MEERKLITHYGEQKLVMSKSYDPVICSAETRNEWRQLKATESFPKNVEFWPMIYNLYSSKYSNICKLIMIKMIMPLTTVQCERSFSALNFIKNDYRSCLGNSANIYR